MRIPHAWRKASAAGSGIWSVLFTLYLYALNFPFASIAATSSAVVLSSLQATFTRPEWVILVRSATAGAGRAFHGVAGAPFLMENSSPKERMHLFAISSAVGSAATFVGSLAAGFLPAYVLCPVRPESIRMALVLSIPVSLVSLVPIGMMKEPKPEGIKDLLGNAVSPRLIAKLVLAASLFAFAAGFSYAFFPLLYGHHHQSSHEQVGLYMGLASLAAAGAILVSPAASRRFGKVNATVVLSMVSVPFLFIMAFSGSVLVVVAAMVARAVAINSAYPVRSVFSMEVLQQKERGTGEGAMHMASDLTMGLAALAAGSLIGATGGFEVPFAFAAIVMIAAAALYFVLFRDFAEGRRGTDRSATRVGAEPTSDARPTD